MSAAKQVLCGFAGAHLVPQLLSCADSMDEAGLADSFYRAVFRISWKNHILCSPCSLEVLPSPNEAPVPPEKSPKYSVPREAFV